MKYRANDNTKIDDYIIDCVTHKAEKKKLKKLKRILEIYVMKLIIHYIKCFFKRLHGVKCYNIHEIYFFFEIY